ncbi:MAG: hypothetical protein GQ582_11810 [Methyloprofundus sp.]|nr:hypothetical protein [Methyloprofundus sp.]
MANSGKKLFLQFPNGSKRSKRAMSILQNSKHRVAYRKQKIFHFLDFSQKRQHCFSYHHISHARKITYAFSRLSLRLGLIMLDAGDLTVKEKALFLDSKKEEVEVFKKSDYLKIVGNKLIIKAAFFDASKRVNDVHRYNLKFIHSKWELTKPCCGKITNNEIVKKYNETIFQCDKEITETLDVNNILIILESPHKSEYNKQFVPKYPASGSTGQQFLRYFISHVLPLLKSEGLRLEENNTYNICFVNPVPYQTSLYEIHRKEELPSSLRNKVWKALYPKCRDDFKQRIKEYAPSIILNACTSDLKSCINGVIFDEEFKDIQQFHAPHPSKWYSYFSTAFKSVDNELKWAIEAEKRYSDTSFFDYKSLFQKNKEMDNMHFLALFKQEYEVVKNNLSSDNEEEKFKKRIISTLKNRIRTPANVSPLSKNTFRCDINDFLYYIIYKFEYSTLTILAITDFSKPPP